jgi:hypothetical protein
MMMIKHTEKYRGKKVPPALLEAMETLSPTSGTLEIPLTDLSRCPYQETPWTLRSKRRGFLHSNARTHTFLKRTACP